jgi:ABC-type Fe3+-siderophore transport system permease subunit
MCHTVDRVFPSRRERYRPAFSLIMFLILLVLLAAVGAFACIVGVKGFTVDKWPQILEPSEGDVLAYTVWQVRMPRVILGMLIGLALAVAGCLIQGITHNPLSDPEIMGVNQGASLFAAAGFILFSQADTSWTILLTAFAGAAVGGSVVYALSMYGEDTPIRLVLAGIAVSLFMNSMTIGLILMYETRLLEILYWMAGKLSGASWLDVRLASFSLVPGAMLAWLFANQFNIFTLGEEVATGLGQNIARVRRFAALLIVVLVGGSVALAGPIGFVGLMVPHMARSITGPDYRFMIPMSAVMGALLLVLADLLGQWVLYPEETPVGIVTGLLGTPFFLYLMRRKGAVA